MVPILQGYFWTLRDIIHLIQSNYLEQVLYKYINISHNYCYHVLSIGKFRCSKNFTCIRSSKIVAYSIAEWLQVRNIQRRHWSTQSQARVTFMDSRILLFDISTTTDTFGVFFFNLLVYGSFFQLRFQGNKGKFSLSTKLLSVMSLFLSCLCSWDSGHQLPNPHMVL